jgi:hypothetical protein
MIVPTLGSQAGSYAIHRFSTAARLLASEIAFTQQGEHREVIQPGMMQFATGLEAVMTQGREYEAKVLEVLKRAVAEALERKRRLGQYAVMWREGRVVCTGPDAPTAPGNNE